MGQVDPGSLPSMAHCRYPSLSPRFATKLRSFKSCRHSCCLSCKCIGCQRHGKATGNVFHSLEQLDMVLVTSTARQGLGVPQQGSVLGAPRSHAQPERCG